MNISNEVIELEAPMVDFLDCEVRQDEPTDEYWDSEMEVDIDMLSHRTMQEVNTEGLNKEEKEQVEHYL